MLSNKHLLQNRYRIEAPIGTGGMGAVYLAVDLRFGTKVAVKQCLAAGARLSLAFEREAQLLNSLRHPALPHVTDYFVEGDNEFIVMQYIDGEDLSQTIERAGAFPVAQVLRWADELLDALEYLHTQKSPIIHRDIKPQNLKLAPDNKIILLDFGLAKGASNELGELTVSKSIYGYSRNYAPLEQIQGSGTDGRSDLYALAATVYHLLSGKPPVDALTRAQVVLSDAADLLRPLNFLNSEISAEVAEILHRALSLNQNARFESAAAMRRALRTENAPADNAQNRVARSPKIAAQRFASSRLPTDDQPEDRFSNSEFDTKTAAPADRIAADRIAAAKFLDEIAAKTVEQPARAESAEQVKSNEQVKSFERAKSKRLSAATAAKAVAAAATLCAATFIWFNNSSASENPFAAKQNAAQAAVAAPQIENAQPPTEQIAAAQTPIAQTATEPQPIETAFLPAQTDSEIANSAETANQTAQIADQSAPTARKNQSPNSPPSAAPKSAKTVDAKPAPPNQFAQPKTLTPVVTAAPAQNAFKPAEAKPAPAAENSDKQKKGKGFFGKIGSGIIKVPKSIFGTKKD